MEKSKRCYSSSDDMFPIVENYYASGLTQKEYCQRKQLAVHLLSYWVRKYKALRSDGQQNSESKFVNLEINTPIGIVDGVEIIYSNGTKVNLVQKVEWTFFEKILEKLDDVSNRN